MLPWQIYTLVKFPETALAERNYNTRHFFEVIEGHGGDFWFHFEQISHIYGTFAPLLLTLGLILLWLKMKNHPARAGVLAIPVVVYLFFSISATKMPSYTIGTSAVLFLAMGTFLDWFLSLIEKHLRFAGKTICVLLIIGAGAFNFDIEKKQDRHTGRLKDNWYYPTLKNNKETFLKIQGTLPEKTIILNAGERNIEAIFYTGYVTYSFITNENDTRKLKEKGRTLAVFNYRNHPIPDYIINDPQIIKLPRID
jgi:hypothetical protein